MVIYKKFKEYIMDNIRKTKLRNYFSFGTIQFCFKYRLFSKGSCVPFLKPIIELIFSIHMT